VTEEAMTRKTAMTAKAKSATGATSQTTKMPIPSFRAFKKEMLPEKMYR